MMMWWWHGTGWDWFWMSAMMVVFWGLIAAAIVAVVRSLGSRPTSDVPSILAERYARGEIGADEYHRRFDDLAPHAGR